MPQRTFLHFDIVGKSPSLWDRFLAFSRIRRLLPVWGLPNDAAITSAKLTIYGGNCPETLAQRIAKKARKKFGYTCFNGFCMIVVTEGQLAALIAIELAALETSQREWAKALVGLTPGGSECVDDPEWCVAFIRRKEEGLSQAMKRFKGRADKMMEKCLEVVQGQTTVNMAEVNFLQKIEIDIKRLGEEK